MKKMRISKFVTIASGFAFFVIISFILYSGFKQDGAGSTDEKELMREIFHGWATDRNEFPFSNFNYAPSDDHSTASTFVVEPEKIIHLSDTEVVLLTKAAIPSAGHVSRAMLGAYWFTLKRGKWILKNRRDEVAWLGSSGDFGNVHVKPLKKDTFGVFIEHGWAGMGIDTKWLAGYEVDLKDIKPLFDSMELVKIHYYSNNAKSFDCEEFLKNENGFEGNFKLPAEEESWLDGCLRLENSWELSKNAKNGYPNFVVHQDKRSISYSVISRDEVEDDYQEQMVIFKLKLNRVKGDLEFKFDANVNSYKIDKGVDFGESL